MVMMLVINSFGGVIQINIGSFSMFRNCKLYGSSFVEMGCMKYQYRRSFFQCKVTLSFDSSMIKRSTLI